MAKEKKLQSGTSCIYPSRHTRGGSEVAPPFGSSHQAFPTTLRILMLLVFGVASLLHLSVGEREGTPLAPHLTDLY